jgi:hypothetical protein
MTSSLDRFFELTDALRAGRPRPDRQAAAFTAVGLVHAAGDVDDLVAATRTAHDAILAGRGRMRAPSGSMRWIHAAMLAAAGVDTAHYLRVVEALQRLEKTAKAGSLYSGGTRAALVLGLAPDTDQGVAQRFFDLKRGLRPPWWRSNSAITDTFAAAHALAGATSTQVQAARERAIAVFGADKRARDFKRDGARLTVLRQDAPEAVLARFNGIEDARREDRFLRARSSRGLAMEWAASGQSASDLPVLSETIRALPRAVSSAGHARARLAHMIAFGDTSDNPAESATAMAAVIAAQAAAMAAIMAATTVTTTTAAT